MTETGPEGPSAGREDGSRASTAGESSDPRYHLACTDCSYETTVAGDGMTAIERSSEHETEMAIRETRSHLVEITVLDPPVADGSGEVEPAAERSEWVRVSRRESNRVSSVRRREGAD